MDMKTKKIMDKFMEQENVQVVGFGKKIVDGLETDVDAMVIGVVEKLPKDKIPSGMLIPKTVNGIKTDVIELPHKIMAGPPITKKDYIARVRPLHPVYSIGHKNITAGTPGAIVFGGPCDFVDPADGTNNADEDYGDCPDTPNETECDGCIYWIDAKGCWFEIPSPDVPNDTDCAPCSGWIDGKCEYESTPSLKMSGPVVAYVLSNNHVLACSSTIEESYASVGDEILQPGPYDGGSVSTDTVANLSCWVPLYTTESNFVDCALAKITVDYDATIKDIGLPVAPIKEVVVGQKVQKSGRTTEHTTGTVTLTGASAKVWYDDTIITFEDQIVTTYMCDGGDSGSLVLDMDKHPIGLLFAGSDEVTIINRIKNVLESLPIDVSFWTEDDPEEPEEPEEPQPPEEEYSWLVELIYYILDWLKKHLGM
jgi:hypothetical protein